MSQSYVFGLFFLWHMDMASPTDDDEGDLYRLTTANLLLINQLLFIYVIVASWWTMNLMLWICTVSLCITWYHCRRVATETLISSTPLDIFLLRVSERDIRCCSATEHNIRKRLWTGCCSTWPVLTAQSLYSGNWEYISLGQGHIRKLIVAHDFGFLFFSYMRSINL